MELADIMVCKNESSATFLLPASFLPVGGLEFCEICYWGMKHSKLSLSVRLFMHSQYQLGLRYIFTQPSFVLNTILRQSFVNLRQHPSPH